LRKIDASFSQNSDVPIFGFEGIDSVFYNANALRKGQISNELSTYTYPEEGMQDSILNSYLENPINAAGFRSIPFKPYSDSKKTKVLLIGDSFVWGFSANPIFNSYADLLLTKDYLVYSAGISGTDPAQYAAIAAKYIPILNPDIVVVNFYVGNDFMAFKRKVSKETPHEYFTASGFLDSYPAGVYLSFEEALVFYNSISKIPQNNLVNIFCSKTRIGTLVLWKTFFALEIVKHPDLTAYYTTRDKPLLEKAEITKVYIDQISELCKKYSVPSVFAVVPEEPFTLSNKAYIKNKGKNKRALDVVFRDIPYDFPTSLCSNNYAPGGHFNNVGNRVYAEFLDDLIKSRMSKE